MQEILNTIIDRIQDHIDSLQDEEIDLFHEVCKDEIS